jgi:hypothetical protein
MLSDFFPSLSNKLQTLTLMGQTLIITFHSLPKSPISMAGVGFVCLIRVLRRTNTVYVIWQHSSFTVGGRPQVPFPAFFQAQTDT